MTPRRRVVVVGGGISGLAAAWELSAHDHLDVEVHEAADRLGGKLATSTLAGLAVEEGADMFLTRTPDAVRLCAEVGIGADRLTSPRPAPASVWVDGRLHRLPGGLVLGFPARFDELASSDLLSPAGVERARREPEVADGPVVGDVAIGPLVTARYGAEVTERIVGPLLGGIAAGDIDEMSLDAVAPQVAEVAHTHRSLVEGLAARLAEAPAGPPFVAPVGGMGHLVDTLAAALAERGVALRTGMRADALPEADGVVVTTPADVAARLVAPRSAAAAELLAAVEFASVAFVGVALRRADVPVALDGSGFLAPRDHGLTVTAVSWASSKWAHLDDPDLAVLRCSVGHRHDDRGERLGDAELLAAVRADLRTTMGVVAEPVATRITRYPRAFPQYAVGHLERTDALEAALAAYAPDVVVCGMAHRGVGIPACVREARAAARTLAAGLSA